MHLHLDFLSWEYWLAILVAILFIMYLIFGGQDHDVVLLRPLHIGVDAVTHQDHKNSEEQDKESDEEDEEEYENASNNAPMISLSKSFEIAASPVIENLVDVLERDKEIVPCNFEIDKNIKSPRSLALGPFQCYKNNKLSKGEAICKQVIEEIYKAPFYCVRPDFLKNPETGRNLELDLYNDFYKIAVERNGLQHSVYPNTFHKTREEFLNQVRRDEFKRKMCDEHGIYLITVPHTVKCNYQDIKSYIEYYLPEKHAQRIANGEVSISHSYSS